MIVGCSKVLLKYIALLSQLLTIEISTLDSTPSQIYEWNVFSSAFPMNIETLGIILESETCGTHTANRGIVKV